MEIWRNYFTLRAAKIWNNLPEEIVTAPSKNTFKNRLDKYWKDQDLLYDNYKAEIRMGSGETNIKWNEEKESGEED